MNRIVLSFAGLVIIIAAVSANLSRALHITQRSLLIADVCFALVLFIVLLLGKRPRPQS